jgi:hypothetical protein
MPDFTVQEMIREVEAEIGMRERVYTRFVMDGKMAPETRERKIGIMRAIREKLRSELPPEDRAEQAELF